MDVGPGGEGAGVTGAVGGVAMAPSWSSHSHLETGDLGGMSSGTRMAIYWGVREFRKEYMDCKFLNVLITLSCSRMHEQTTQMYVCKCIYTCHAFLVHILLSQNGLKGTN